MANSTLDSNVTNKNAVGKYAAVNGLNLYYEIHSKGPGSPLVLLHGGLG